MPKKKPAKAKEKKPLAKKRKYRAKKPRKSVRKEPALSAEQLGALEAGVLEGRTLRAIAMEMGVPHQTLVPHLRDVIRPAWRENSGRTVDSLLARLDQVSRNAWAMFHQVLHKEGQRAAFSRPGGAAWLGQVVDCLKEEAKLLGQYKPAQVQIKPEEKEGFRIAGMSTAELDTKMMALVLEKIKKTHE